MKTSLNNLLTPMRLGMLGISSLLLILASLNLGSRAECIIKDSKVYPRLLPSEINPILALVGWSGLSILGLSAFSSLREASFRTEDGSMYFEEPELPLVGLPDGTQSMIALNSPSVGSISAEEKPRGEIERWEEKLNFRGLKQSDVELLKSIGLILGSLVYLNIPRHLLISAVTRCGKSITLKAYLYSLWVRFEGRVHFCIIDPKNSDWLGLEKQPEIVRYATSDVDTLLETLEYVHSLMCYRIDNRLKGDAPFYLVVDELTALLTLAKAVDKRNRSQGNKKAPKYEAEIQYFIGDICRRGLEYGIHITGIVQTHYCTALGMSSHDRMSFILNGLARHEVGYEMVENILNDSNAVPNRNRALESQGELEALKPRAKETGRPALYTTHLDGQIGLLPDLTWVEGREISCLPLPVLEEEAEVFVSDAPPPILLEKVSSPETQVCQDLEQEIELRFHSEIISQNRPISPLPPPSSPDEIISRITELTEKGWCMETAKVLLAKPLNPDSSDWDIFSKIQELSEARTQTEIIYAIWGAKPGGSEAYKKASAEYKRLSEKFSIPA